MQKLKKALTKLAGLTSSKSTQSGKVAAQPAKKVAPVKKKSQPVTVIKKNSGAAAAGGKKNHPVKKAHPVKPMTGGIKAKAAATKPESKDAKKKMPVTTAAVMPSKGKTEKFVEKGKKPAHAAVTSAPVKKAADKVAEKVVVKTPTAPVVPPVEQKKARKPEDVRSEAAPAPAAAPAAAPADEEVVLTDAEGRRYCRVKDCDQIASVEAYCRYHYLLFWKNIQNRKKILSEGKLERYIEELTARYPDKYLEMLRKDLRNEKDFLAAIQELEIDDSSVDNEFEDEAQSYLDEVRGMGAEASGGGREEEDY